MRRAVAVALKLLVSGGLLWLALRMMPGDLLATIARPDPAWIAAMVGMSLLGLALMSIRLRLLASGTHLSPGSALAVTWAGQFGTMLGLGLLSADGTRVALLMRHGAGLSRATQLVLLDRVLGISGLGILAIAGWVAHLAGPGAGLAALGALLVLAVLILGGMGRAVPRLALARLPLPTLALGLLLSVLLHGTSIAIYLGAALALGLHPPVAQSVVAVSLGLFFAILPISVGGWGVREVAIAQGFGLVGVPFPEAAAVSVLFGVIAGLVALLGVIAVFRRRPVLP